MLHFCSDSRLAYPHSDCHALCFVPLKVSGIAQYLPVYRKKDTAIFANKQLRKLNLIRIIYMFGFTHNIAMQLQATAPVGIIN